MYSDRQQWKEDLLKRLLMFGVKIIQLTNDLPRTPAGYTLSSQIIRSGTSIGANIEEAQDASSKKDFVQKVSIALREAKETRYWLNVLVLSELIMNEKATTHLDECGQIIGLLTSSLKTAKSKLP